MAVRKGMRVQELTKKVGRHPRAGTVVDIRGSNVEVKWDDGRTTTLSGAYLVPERREKTTIR